MAGSITLTCGCLLTNEMTWAFEEGLLFFNTKDYSDGFGPDGESETYHAVSSGVVCLDCQAKYERDDVLLSEAEEQAWLSSSPALA